MRTQKKNRTGRRTVTAKSGLVAAVVLVLLAVAGCKPEATHETKEVPRNVRVLELTRGDLQEYVEVSGPVEPVRGADLSAQESGPVVALPVRKGGTVDVGQTIVEQERKILRAERDAARSALDTQAYNVDKVRRLHAAGKVSQIDLLTAEEQYVRARSAAEVATERYDRAGVSAPFAGVVTDRYVELGQLVTPGQPVARVIDPYVLKLEGYLTGEQVGWLTVGTPAEIRLGDDGALATGEISWVGFEADRMTGKFKVEIEIDNSDLAYRSGVIGRARIPKNRVAKAVTIPRDAVLPGRAGPTAFVVEGDRAKLRRITLGVDQGLMVVVTSGLEPGDDLVVRGHRELRDGSLVTITERSTRADGSLPSDPPAVTGRAHEDTFTDQPPGLDPATSDTPAAGTEADE